MFNTCVLHYYCSNCNDEQVTNYTIVYDIIDSLEDDSAYVTYGVPCTNCGYKLENIDDENILGIEFI